MRSTKLRLLDRHATGVFFVLALLMGGASATACGNDAAVRSDDADAEVRYTPTASGDELDASTDVQDTTADAGQFDAGQFDAAVREVSCEASSCAIALTRPNKASSAGQSFCALLHDGTVTCWGSNSYGQLGNGLDDQLPSVIPQRVVGLSDVVSLNGSCALDKDGSAWCWGAGPNLATFPLHASSPVKLPIPAATRLGMSDSDACALIDGELQCWGYNNAFLRAPGGTSNTPIPVPVPGAANARDVVLGAFAAILLRDDGTLLSWGYPRDIGRATSLVPDRNPDPVALANVTNVSIARTVVCAVANGIPYCWGALKTGVYNTDIQLPQPVVTPERVVQIATTDALGPLPPRWCAVGGSGAVYCWGKNANGQAGDGTTQHAMTAVKVPVPALAVHVETTEDSTCALLVTGKVLCWGSNYDGQLGNGKGKTPSLVPTEVLLP